MQLSSQIKTQLKTALKEDVGPGDWTSRLLVSSHQKAKAKIVARENGVFSGEAVTRYLIRAVDSKLRVRLFTADGRRFKRKKTILSVEGRLLSLLKLERTLLNFLARLSGVATLTRVYVDKTKKYRVRIMDTRKTTPLWRELEKAAVRHGGGSNHRMGLYDEVFVKENHRCYGSLQKLEKIPRQFVLEVRNLKELRKGLLLKPRILLFDNFSPQGLKKAVRFARRYDRKVLLEASGGITLKNVAAYARTGVDQISVGSLTHSVQAINLSMIIH